MLGAVRPPNTIHLTATKHTLEIHRFPYAIAATEHQESFSLLPLAFIYETTYRAKCDREKGTVCTQDTRASINKTFTFVVMNCRMANRKNSGRIAEVHLWTTNVCHKYNAFSYVALFSNAHLLNIILHTVITIIKINKPNCAKEMNHTILNRVVDSIRNRFNAGVPHFKSMVRTLL